MAVLVLRLSVKGVERVVDVIADSLYEEVAAGKYFASTIESTKSDEGVGWLNDQIVLLCPKRS
jgi:hypothetical protein